MFKNVRALGKDILVERIHEEQKTLSGLYIPDEANEFGNKLYRAQVLDVGEEVVNIKKDMTILCKFGAGISVDYDVIMMKEEEVIGRF
jgi:co-chaperonin GroES (HSP10)